MTFVRLLYEYVNPVSSLQASSSAAWNSVLRVMLGM